MYLSMAVAQSLAWKAALPCCFSKEMAGYAASVPSSVPGADISVCSLQCYTNVVWPLRPSPAPSGTRLDLPSLQAVFSLRRVSWRSLITRRAVARARGRLARAIGARYA